MSFIFWFLVGIVGVALIIAVWLIAVYNSIVKLRVLSEEAFSGMDIFMKMRNDLIPNLVETLKGYMAHESQTLESVITARSRAISTSSADSIETRVDCERELGGAVSRMMMVAEQYPELKADSQFLNLSQQLTSVETDIAQARKYYNGAVRMYNTRIALFPVTIVAGMGRFIKLPYFELDDVGERDVPLVSLT